MTARLYPFQEECIRSIAAHARNHAQGAVVLPTGSGKTTIAAALLQRRDQGRRPGKTLILAHSAELLKQWKKVLRQQLNGAPITLVSAGQHDWSGDIIVGSVRSIARDADPPVDEICVVIVDECHHALSPEWGGVIERFRPRYKLGLTATPLRGDGRCVATAFGSIIYMLDLQRLIDLKYLVDARGWRIRTDTDISDIPLTLAGDFVVPELSRRVNDRSRNRLAIDAYIRRGEGKPAIAFCADVAHAAAIAQAAQEAGIAAAYVHGGLSRATRTTILERFERGEITLVANCGILTEGYNNEQATVALLCRPYTHISARVLLPQSVGRVLRLAENKPYAIVIELIDRELRGRGGSLDDVFGDALEDCQGDLLSRRAAQARARANRDLASRLIEALRRFVEPVCDEGFQRSVPRELWERFNVITYVQNAAGFSWLRGPGRIYLNLGTDPQDESRSPRWADIRPSIGGLFAATLHQYGEVIPLTVAGTEQEAINDASSRLIADNDSGLGLARSRARWRTEQASTSQCQQLARITGLPAYLFADLTRGMASDIISALQSARTVQRS